MGPTLDSWIHMGPTLAKSQSIENLSKMYSGKFIYINKLNLDLFSDTSENDWVNHS